MKNKEKYKERKIDEIETKMIKELERRFGRKIIPLQSIENIKEENKEDSTEDSAKNSAK